MGDSTVAAMLVFVSTGHWNF